jgi:hypothetical protein
VALKEPAMPKADPVAELARKLSHALEQQRQSGGDYPLTVARLAALADPQATPEQVRKALTKKPFDSTWIVAVKKDAGSPIALAEDGERLAASPLLLEFALGLVCGADKPVHPLTKVVNTVDKALRSAFRIALERRIAENTLPPTVGVTIVRRKPHLYLQKFPPPPPPPPKKKPAEELSEKLVQVLTQRRESGTDAYPVPLDRLIAETGIAATPAVVKKALGLEPFRGRAVLPLPSLPDSLVALAADAERLLASPGMFHQALAAARTPDNQILSVADLKKKLAKNLQAAFTDAVNRQLDARVLPDGIGVLYSKKKPLLFLLADLRIGPLPTAPKPSPAPLPMDFAHLFDEAFARLDREHGSHNHVSLVALRRILSVDRAAFDAGLRQLRRDGRYSLSAAEGRHGLSAEEQDAAIREDGSMLLFVSKREG